MSQHSPLPWRAIKRANQAGVRVATIVDAKARPVAEFSGLRNITTAALSPGQIADVDTIVRAVNAHEELVSALRTAHYELLTLHPRLSEPYARNVMAAVDKCSAALAKAGAK